MPRTKKAARRGQRKQKEDKWRTDITKNDMNNACFAMYYKAQEIVPVHEWEDFLDSLRTALPTTFRIASSRQTANELRDSIEKTYVPLLSCASFEGEPVPPPVPIPWYPDGLAWQFNVPKKGLRKSPEFKKFHSFLVFETEVGNISRQEAVSMLPPLFLDVQPFHQVIDMCAAPGSKTAQILEALHAHDTLGDAQPMPSGFIIANDSDQKRTHLLIHQSARLPSPALMVTNLDASMYPTIRLPSTNTDGSDGSQISALLFDRILCDVPCSGDGTIRKNVGIWKTWNPMDGNGLHGLQLRILQRAMKLLKNGGRIVYSTCSLNPVENEAVVAAALNVNSDFELVDVSTRMPRLIRRPGLTSWRPSVDKAATKLYGTYEEYIATLSEKQKAETKLSVGHWPPQNVGALHLERCMRIYPHLQDSGGFFLAVLQKKADLLTDVQYRNERPKQLSSSSQDAGHHHDNKHQIDRAGDDLKTKRPRLAENAGGSTPLEFPLLSNQTPTGALQDPEALPSPSPLRGEYDTRGTVGSFQENPYTFLAPDDPILLSCIEKLRLSASFPVCNVLVRNPAGEAARSLYLTNDVVKSIVLHNDYDRLRLTSCGTKILVKQEGGKGVEAQFRALGEAMPVLLPFIDPSSIVDAGLSALKTLISSLYPLVDSFEEPFRRIIEDRPLGCHIVRFCAGTWEDAALTHDIVLPVWRSHVSVSLLVDKKAKSALSMRVFGKDVTVAGREVERKNEPPSEITPPFDTQAGQASSPEDS